MQDKSLDLANRILWAKLNAEMYYGIRVQMLGGQPMVIQEGSDKRDDTTRN